MLFTVIVTSSIPSLPVLLSRTNWNEILSLDDLHSEILDISLLWKVKILQRLLIACATNIRLFPVLKSGNLNGLLTVSSTNIGLFSVVNSGDFEKNFVISCDQCNILFNRFYSSQ